MASFLTITLLFGVLGTVRGATLKDNSPKCGCYVTDGSSSAYYLYHRFFDFRNLHDSSGRYDEPANVTDQQSRGDEPGQQGYLNSTVFSEDWQILNWGKEATSTEPVKLQNSPQNVWIQTNDDGSTTHLSLRTYRNTGFSSTAEVESLQRNLFHSSIRLRARVRGASGAVAGMFTYLDDSTESDIEILTSDPPNQIRYSNQPSTDSKGDAIPEAETDAILPDPAVWTDWITHRIDWTPRVSAWYADGVLAASKTYGIPQSPSYLTLNMWSNGGVWSDNMTIGSAAYLEIQWIDMVFNTSGPATGVPEQRSLKARTADCRTVCAVDGIKQTGFPEILHQPSSAASGLVVNSLFLLLFLMWWMF